MTIPYVPNSTWVDNTTPRSSARLGVIETGIYDAHYMPAARVNATSWNLQNLAISSWGVLAYGSAVFDQASGGASSHWNVSLPTRLTAQYPGKYLLTGENVCQQGISPLTYLAIRLNGSTILASRACTGSNKYFCLATEVTLAVGDYVEAAVYNASAYTASYLYGSMAMVRVA